MNERSIRILATGLGILLLFHGVDKILTGVEGIEKLFLELHLSREFAHYITYGVYIGEVVAPILLIFGQYIKIASILVVVDMLFAIGLVYRETLFQLGDYGEWIIETPLLFLIAALSLAVSNIGFNDGFKFKKK